MPLKESGWAGQVRVAFMRWAGRGHDLAVRVALTCILWDRQAGVFPQEGGKGMCGCGSVSICIPGTVPHG